MVRRASGPARAVGSVAGGLAAGGRSPRPSLLARRADVVYPQDEEYLGEIVAFAAEHLGARLLGGDDEEYLPDGTVVSMNPAERPDFPARPL